MIDRHQDFSQYKKDPVSVTDKFLLQRFIGFKED
jgi:hypothetical protein